MDATTLSSHEGDPREIYQFSSKNRDFTLRIRLGYHFIFSFSLIGSEVEKTEETLSEIMSFAQNVRRRKPSTYMPYGDSIDAGFFYGDTDDSNVVIQCTAFPSDPLYVRMSFDYNMERIACADMLEGFVAYVRNEMQKP